MFSECCVCCKGRKSVSIHIKKEEKNEQYLVLGDRDTVSLDGEVSTLVDKGADGLLRRVSVVVWWR